MVFHPAPQWMLLIEMREIVLNFPAPVNMSFFFVVRTVQVVSGRAFCGLSLGVSHSDKRIPAPHLAKVTIVM